MKRMPSKPLFGMPVVVGMSVAVIAMRSVWARAGLAPAVAAAASATRAVR